MSIVILDSKRRFAPLPNNPANGYSFLGSDDQHRLIYSDVTTGQKQPSDAFSICIKFRYDLATEEITAGYVTLLGNADFNGVRVGWELGLQHNDNKVRFEITNSLANRDLVRFSISALVVDTVYSLGLINNGDGTYACYLNGNSLTPSIDTNTYTSGSTDSGLALYLNKRYTGFSGINFMGLSDEVMIVDKALSQAEFNEYRNSESEISNYTVLSYANDVSLFVKAENGFLTGSNFNFANNAGSGSFIADEKKDFFKRGYDLFNWTPTTTMTVTDYASNPILQGTSDDPKESYDGDILLDTDNTVKAICKAVDHMYVFSGADIDNLNEVNEQTLPDARFPYDYFTGLNIRKIDFTYYIFGKRQITADPTYDVSLFTTTDLTTDTLTWTLTTGLINTASLPFQGSITTINSPCDIFKFNDKWYMLATFTTTVNYYIAIFEADTITGTYTYKSTVFDLNEARILDTLNDSDTTTTIQGGSVIYYQGKYYCTVTIGKANDDVANERYNLLGIGNNPFEFEFWKTPLNQAGALGTWSERRVYQPKFWKKQDGKFLTLQSYQDKNWILYAGHALISNYAQSWGNTGWTGLLHFTELPI